MNASAFRPSRSRIFLIVLSIGISGILYFGFGLYLKNSAEAMAENWLRSEKIAIHQGDFLTSAAKLQSITQVSEFLTGFALFDLEAGKRELFHDGTVWPTPDLLESQTLLVKSKFPLRVVVAVPFPSQSKVVILYFYPKILILGLLLFMLLTIGFAAGVFLFSHRQEQRLFEEFLKAQDLTARQIMHDLQSPLTALRLAGHIRAQGSVEELKKLIGNAANRIQSITEDLNFKYVRNTRVQLKPVDLGDVLMAAVTEKRGQYPSMQFQFHGSDDARPLNSDPALLARVFSNLLQNAIEASQECAQNEISIHLNTDDRHRIEIRDRGPGIDPAIRQKILKGGFTTKKGGSGLGLYHAQRSLESLGGNLRLAPVDGGGLTVEVALPAV